MFTRLVVIVYNAHVRDYALSATRTEGLARGVSHWCLNHHPSLVSHAADNLQWVDRLQDFHLA